MSVPRSRLLLIAGALAIAAACGGDGADTGAPSPDATATTTPTATPEPTPEIRTIDVEVRDGEVVGGPQRFQVSVGEDVQIVVTSDVADEVHVHGYDFTEDVEAGGERSILFTVDIPGVFEVELEERGLRLLTLEVR